VATGLHAGCFVLGLTVLVYRLYEHLVGPRTLLPLVLTTYMAASTVSFFVLLPPVYAAIGRLTGVPNLAGAISGVCVLILVSAQQVLLMHWTHSPALARTAVRRRLSLIGLALGAYVAAFAWQIPVQQRFDDFYVHYSKHVQGAPYLVIYIVTCTLAEIDVFRYCLRYVRIAPPSWLRRGMVVTVVGAGAILAYCVIRIADLVGGAADVDLRGLEVPAWLFGDVGSALSLTGWVLPTVGQRWPAVVAWGRTYRRLRELYPLWALVLRAVPGVALEHPTSRLRDLMRVRDLDFWLYRRVIEIEDGLRVLQPAALGEPCGPAPASLVPAEVAALVDVLRDQDVAARRDHRSRTSTDLVQADSRDYADNLDRLTALARRVRAVPPR
jgi:hypothetical protein